MKVITLPPEASRKEQLIERISNATNHQTPVGPSDRLSNMEEQVYLQQRLFNEFGVLYERKRGEYSDGISKGLIKESDIIDRSLFIKIYYILQNKISSSKTKKLFVTHKWNKDSIDDNDKMLATIFGCMCYRKLQTLSKTAISDLDMLGKVKVMVRPYNNGNIADFDSTIEQHSPEIAEKWSSFLDKNSEKVYQKTTVVEPGGGTKTVYKRARTKMRKWINSEDFITCAKTFFV